MKIAHVIPVMTTIPPKKYGGIEEVVQELAVAQAKSGHQVTIFAAHGSGFKRSKIKIIESAPFPTVVDLSQNRKWELHEFLKVLSAQDGFDLVHLHYEPIIAQALVDSERFNLFTYLHVPFLLTVHNDTNIKKHVAYYRKQKDLWPFHYVFISKSQRWPLRFLPHSHIIYNGIPVERFKFNAKPKDYFLFLGRIMKKKGIVEAIKVAKLTGRRLIIAAKIDPVDRKFYDQKVRHLIDGKQIVYVGEVGFKQKVEYYRNATALLFPISWEEPFGLVMIEAMACGTPVIAFRNGSVPEVVKHGKTGFVVKTVDEMVKAVSRIGEIKRSNCRRHVEENFSSKTMAENYEKLYRKIVASKVKVKLTKQSF